MTTSCISEESALRILLEPSGEETAGHRAHVAECETCRGFVAALARVMLPPSTPSFGGWGADSVALAPGTKLKHYVVESVLGRGGMGVVHAGHDTRLNRPVAIKILAQSTAPGAVARLRREAAVMAQLSHANVVEVFDFGECDSGPFVVMELLHGRTLRHWLDEEQRSADEIVSAYVQAGRGLAAAHARGIVHRDFKPANVMRTGDGDQARVKVLDFGLATPLAGGNTPSEGASGSPRTLDGGGTPRYAAPEQFSGAPATILSDQFSFCVALFESLCGRVPYPGSTMSERRTAMLSGRMEALAAKVSPEIEAALRRGLELDPRRRHRSMGALLSALAVRPRARRFVGGAVLLSLSAFAVWPSPEAPCADGSARMRQAWTPGREELTGRPELVTKAAAIDAYAESWLGARARLCALRREEPTRFERGAACLERLATVLERVSGQLDQVATQVEPMPSNLLGELRDPTECVALRTKGANDPVLRDELSELQARAAAADQDGFIDPQELQDVTDEVGTLLRRARQLGDGSAQAALLRLQGTLEYLRGDYAASERTLEAAYFVADLADDASMQLHVCEGLILLLALLGEEPDRVGSWVTRARTAAEQIGTDNVLGRAAWLEAIGARVEGRLEDAMASSTRAIEWLHSDSETRLLVYTQLGEVAMQTGDGGRARIALAAALELAERELGDTHPSLAAPLNALASVEMAEGNVEDGLALISRAIEVLPESKGLLRAYLQANLANGIRELGQLDAALEGLASARAVFEAELGLNNPQTIRVARDWIETLAALGHEDEAGDEAERLLGTPGLANDEVAGILQTRAFLAEDPRPYLNRILELEDVHPLTKSEARAQLSEFAEAR